MARTFLLSKRSLERGYFQREQIGFLLDKHDAPHDHSKQLWDLLMLELWHRTFIDQVVPKWEVMDEIHSTHTIIT